MAIFDPAKAKRVIENIEYEVTTGFVRVDLFTTVDEQDDKTLPYFIRLEELHEWLSYSGYLEWETNHSHTVTGQHVQESGLIGFVDFLQNHLTDEILYDYLTAKGTINLEYRPV